METVKSGIQLVPPLPVSITDRLSDGNDYSEIIAYRNKLIETRNAQLEYHQNISNLHSKIRDACRDLSRKDNNVKSDIETLAMERSRLAYLRDELSRRADVISRWEARVRASESKKGSEVKFAPSEDEMKRKERDRANAMLLELEQRRKLEMRAASVDVASNSSVQEPIGFITNENVGQITIHRDTPRSEAIGSDDINMVNKEVDTMGLMSITRRSTQEGLPAVNLSERSKQSSSQSSRQDSRIDSRVEVTTNNDPPSSMGISVEVEKGAPRPYPAWASSGEDQFLHDMTVCLDYLWNEYSTLISEGDNTRLMTLPNLLRLAGDADFNLDTQIVIELFLRTVKLGSNCLVEKRNFLALLQAAATVCARSAMDRIQTTDFLFSDYLFPLMHRLKIKERIMTGKHPSLSRSSLPTSFN